MKTLPTIILSLILPLITQGEVVTAQSAQKTTSAFITGYTLTQSRAAELGSLGNLWDGYKMNVVRGDIGESVAERAFFGGPDLAHSKKGSWVSIAPRLYRQGIDHVFILVNDKGLPKNMILAESKYGNSKLGTTQKGKQMGTVWRQDHLNTISKNYFKFSNSSTPIIRAKTVPIGANTLDLYLSKTHKITIWESDGKWYANSQELTDSQLKTRATSYGKFFSSAANGVVRTRNFLFRIQEQNNRDYLVTISKLSDEAEIISTRTSIVPKEFISKGRVDNKTLKEALKRRHPSWSDKQIAQEAKMLKKVISNKEFIEAVDAQKKAVSEINTSSLASAGFAGGFSLLFQLASEAYEHGTDFKSYDYKNISLTSIKGAASAGAASYLGQRTALYLTGKTILNKQITSRTASRIGGGVGTAIILAESFGGCIMGNKNWKDGSIEAGIGAASMLAGHAASTAVSALFTSSAAAGTATAAAAGTATAASAGTAGTIAAGATGAGAASSSGFMALAAASGPAVAAVLAGAAISYGGYAMYNHYKANELITGEFIYNSSKIKMFLEDEKRYDQSLNHTLGFH